MSQARFLSFFVFNSAGQLHMGDVARSRKAELRALLSPIPTAQEGALFMVLEGLPTMILSSASSLRQSSS